MLDSKQELRKRLRSELGQLDTNQVDRFSGRIVQELQNLLSLISYQFVGAFYPIKGEPAIVNFLSQEKKLALPRWNDSKMNFHQCGVDELVDEEKFGRIFKVPSKDNLVVQPEVLVIPGIAFDEKGNRLGRGKAYYDRYLRDFKGIKIGVCYRLQILKEVPTEEHDCPMDFIVSESGVLDLQGANQCQ